ncbi:MAG: hypothetical protein RL325_1544, partial [Planctomycetota bacterium]
MKRSSTLIGAFAMTSCAIAQTFVENGGFESGGSQQPCEWVLHGAGSTAIPGWSVLTGNVDRQRLAASCNSTHAGWRSYEGEFTVDLNGFNAGGLRQTIAVLPNSPMRLAFVMTGNCVATTVGLTRSLTLEIDGSSWTFDHQCAAGYPQPWVEHFVDFTPTSQTSVISFQSLTSDTTLGPVIDSVRAWEIQPNRIQNGGFETGDAQGACQW